MPEPADEAIAERKRGPKNGSRRKLRVLLIGEGGALRAAESALSRRPDLELAGSTLGGALQADADAMLVAEAPRQLAAMRSLLAQAAEAGLELLILDGDDIRPLRLDDLIGRDIATVADDDAMRRAYAGKSVLITGGGGSIGAALARKIAAWAPKRLTLLDSSEANLHAIGSDLPQADLRIVDVRDLRALKRCFDRAAPELVFHAAALKQVPLVEANASEGFLSNVVGCVNAVDLAWEAGAGFALVSTDKAVNPSGVMGATKRLGEMYCQALDVEAAKRNGPRYLSIRLGNVLGSTGSVAPVFEAQIAKGGPLKVTDAHVTRYFVTIPQAAAFLAHAMAFGAASGAGRGGAFVPDMGDPIAIVDLARDMILLNGLRPETDIEIEFIGLRPGEKLHEDLVASDETQAADLTPGMFAAASSPGNLLKLRDAIEQLTHLAQTGADAEIAARLRDLTSPQIEQGRKLA
jgi:O-antigen biosynthesis protein WbqV